MSRRVFITGGASGLGRALAERFARAGDRVCIADIHDARGAETLAVISKLAPDAVYVRCDVTSEAHLIAARELLEAQWGGVDVVINNAGVAQAGAIDAVSMDDWQWIVDINLLGVVNCIDAVLPGMRERGRGHLAAISSMASFRGLPRMGGYCASKAGLNALLDALRIELKPLGIAVSTLCPGWVRTDMGGPNADRSVEEGADTAVWLADEAPQGLTGKFFRDRQEIPW